MNKGIKKAPLNSDQFIPVHKSTRLRRSDSLLHLCQKKASRPHEHLIAREHILEQNWLPKLQLELIPHRINHDYCISGKGMTLRDRYAVPEEELLRLKNLNLKANAALYYGKGIK